MKTKYLYSFLFTCLHFSSSRNAKDAPTRLHILLWDSQFSPSPVSPAHPHSFILHISEKTHFLGAPRCQGIPVVAEDLGLPQTLMLWESTGPPCLKHCCERPTAVPQRGAVPLSLSGIKLSFTLAQVGRKVLGNEVRKQWVGGGTWRHHHLPTSLLTRCFRPAPAVAAMGVSMGRSGGRKREREIPARSEVQLACRVLPHPRQEEQRNSNSATVTVNWGRRRKGLGTAIIPFHGQEPSAF